MMDIDRDVNIMTYERGRKEGVKINRKRMNIKNVNKLRDEEERK